MSNQSNLGRHAEQQYFPGMRVGDYKNTDGTVGLLIINRIKDDNGNLTSSAIFECPNDGKHFKAAIKDVVNGRTTSCHDCAAKKKTVHSVGTYIGTFSNGDDLPNGMLILARDTKSKTFLVQCPKCHTIMAVTKNTVLKADMSICSVCKWNNTHPEKAYRTTGIEAC